MLLLVVEAELDDGGRRSGRAPRPFRKASMASSMVRRYA